MTNPGIVLYHGIDSGPEDAGFDSSTILWYGTQLFEFPIVLIGDA